MILPEQPAPFTIVAEVSTADVQCLLHANMIAAAFNAQDLLQRLDHQGSIAAWRDAVAKTVFLRERSGHVVLDQSDVFAVEKTDRQERGIKPRHVALHDVGIACVGE
jgi:hypothetical protein